MVADKHRKKQTEKKHNGINVSHRSEAEILQKMLHLANLSHTY